MCTILFQVRKTPNELVRNYKRVRKALGGLGDDTCETLRVELGKTFLD